MKYAPKVIVSIVEGALDTGRIPEGNIVSLLCQADANPSDITYRWYINDEQIDGQTAHVVTVFNVTRDYQNSLVKCVVQNSVGISSDTEAFDVICMLPSTSAISTDLLITVSLFFVHTQINRHLSDVLRI